MKSFITGHVLATLISIHTALAQATGAPAVPTDSIAHTPFTPSPNNGFVTIKDGHFFLGDKLFDFKGINAPNLISANWNDFRTIDTFKTISRFGTPVTRTYTLTIYNSHWAGSTSAEAGHIIGWDTVANDWLYNEAAFVKMDQVLARAAEYGVKLIIPLINQDYGKEWENFVGNYVDLIRHRHGLSKYVEAQAKVDFFADMPFRADYKKIIDYLLKRKNTVNGRIYGQDDVVLAWETGNEMNWASANQTEHLRPAPANWTIDIAQQLKTLAPKTLVMDGSLSRNPTLSEAWPEECLKSPYIDLFSYHMWGSGEALTEPSMKKHVESYGKVFVVGEHGFYATGAEFDGVITNFTSAGSLIWGMRSHHESGGFVTHGEGVTSTGTVSSHIPMVSERLIPQFRSYHFPGWNSSTSTNFDSRELAVARSTYENSWSFIGANVPEYPVPDAPVLKDASTNTTAGITWLGAAWAEHYELYGASVSESSFKLISDHLLDNVEGGKLFVPVTAPLSTGAPLATREFGMGHRMAKHHGRSEHRRQATGTETAPADGGWYILRGVSVDGKKGPWSAPLFVKTMAAAI